MKYMLDINLKSALRRSNMATLDEIRQKLDEQRQKAPETAEERKLKAIFRNGMELPCIEQFPVVHPAVDPDILFNSDKPKDHAYDLRCPNEDCIEPTQHLHKGTIVENDRDIYIPFTCEHCEFTFVLQFLVKSGTCYLSWNKSIL